jgi:glycosyltransferase involved in cell wall biosynthesis
MPGWREDVISLLAASDLFVLTSLWEGLPRALLEALYVGIPALCYETDGVKDLFSSDALNVVPRKDWNTLAQRVITLLAHPLDMKAWAVRDKQKIDSHFDIDVMVRQQERLYLELVAAAQ